MSTVHRIIKCGHSKFISVNRLTKELDLDWQAGDLLDVTKIDSEAIVLTRVITTKRVPYSLGAKAK